METSKKAGDIRKRWGTHQPWTWERHTVGQVLQPDQKVSSERTRTGSFLTFAFCVTFLPYQMALRVRELRENLAKGLDGTSSLGSDPSFVLIGTK